MLVDLLFDEADLLYRSIQQEITTNQFSRISSAHNRNHALIESATIHAQLMDNLLSH